MSDRIDLAGLRTVWRTRHRTGEESVTVSAETLDALVDAVEAARKLALSIDTGLDREAIAALDWALQRFDFAPVVAAPDSETESR